MTAQELEALMVKQYGPNWRDYSIVGPLGTFHLESVFEECGLRDPRAPATALSYGLWQCASRAS